MDWSPEFKKAVTIKEISGTQIPTIPKGTEFLVLVNGQSKYYKSCKGLPINSVWNNEFRLTEEPVTRVASGMQDGLISRSS